MVWWLILGIVFLMALGFFSGIGVYLMFFEKKEESEGK